MFESESLLIDDVNGDEQWHSMTTDGLEDEKLGDDVPSQQEIEDQLRRDAAAAEILKEVSS